MMQTKQVRRWPGWMIMVLLVGAGVMLALWVQEGAPGWKLLAGMGGAAAIVGLLLSATATRRRLAMQGLGTVGLIGLAVMGAWWLLTTLAELVARLLR